MLGWQVIKYPTLRQLYISKCLCRMIHLSTSRQTDYFPQPSKLWFSFVWNSDRLAFRFPSPVSGSSWLVSKGVCGRFFSFSISKPQSPRPRKHTPELCPLHLRPTDTQAFVHACKHTHRYAAAAASLHICLSAEACTSFINAQVTSHPQLVYIYSNHFLSYLQHHADTQNTRQASN